MIRFSIHLILMAILLVSTSGISVFRQMCAMRGQSVAAFEIPVDCTGESPILHSDSDGHGCCSHFSPVFGTQVSAPPCCDHEGSLHQLPLGSTAPTVIEAQIASPAVAILPNLAGLISFSSLPSDDWQPQPHAPPPSGSLRRVLFQSFLC